MINKPSWDRFVNVYRMFFGTNNGLDSAGIRALTEEELKEEITRMSKILREQGLMK